MIPFALGITLVYLKWSTNLCIKNGKPIFIRDQVQNKRGIRYCESVFS